jgi:hypothetical protein
MKVAFDFRVWQDKVAVAPALVEEKLDICASSKHDTFFVFVFAGYSLLTSCK